MKRSLRRFIFITLTGIVLGRHGSLQAQINVSITNTPVLQGSPVDIPVNITGISVSDSILSYQMTLWFDSDVVQCVGATSATTMTQQWGDPYVGPVTDTVRIGGFTTNQPTKRLVPDLGRLVKLQFLVVGSPGSSSLVKFIDMKLFNINGAMTINNKTNGTLTVVENPNITSRDITLYPSWNLISFPLVPTDTLPDIFNGIPVIYVAGYFSGEDEHKTWAASRPSWANSLKSVDGLHGYWMRLNSDVQRTWTVSGNLIPVTTPIPLYSGWNRIGYLPLYADVISHSFESLGSLYSYIYEYNGAQGEWKRWGRGKPSWWNSLTSLTPLFGYWVKLDSARTLVYPSGGYSVPKLASSSYDLLDQDQKDPPIGNVSGPPEYCEFWAYQVGVFNIGDRIQAYDTDGVMCGDTVAVVDGGFIVNVAGDDIDTPEIDEGAVTGDEIRFKVNGDSSVVIGASAHYDSVVVMGEKAIWQNMGSQRVKLTLIDSGLSDDPIRVIPDKIDLFQNYPNPFNSQTVISYHIGTPGDVTIKIFDATGRNVKTLIYDRFHEPGQYHIQWDGCDEEGKRVSSGIYIYQLWVDTIRLNKKMVLLY